jgi:hypothetical protein
MLKSPRLLFWLGMVCFVPILFPVIRQEKLPNGTKSSITIGLPSSPWFNAYRTEIKEETKQESKTDNSTSMNMSFSMRFDQKVSVEFISWSALLAVVGMVLITLSRRLKKNILSSDKSRSSSP